MDATVEPVGWTPFDSARPVIMNTTFYAEFDSTGKYHTYKYPVIEGD